MVTQISFGNLGQQNGRTTINGSQSGIDTEALIKALSDAKRLPAVRLETKNETLASQKTALASLQSLLTRFKSAVESLRNPPGVDTASKNIFEYRKASLSTNNGLNASNYVSVTTLPGAPIQNFTINDIEQLAQETKQETGLFLLPDTTTASAVTANGAPEAGKFAAGTFSLRALDGGTPIDITLNEGESLQSVVNKFNNVKGSTGIQANIIKVASGTPNNSYEIIFTATKTGLDAGFDLENPTTVVADASGVLGQIAFNTTQPARNAKFTLDGVPLERATNSMSDVISGMTFSLKQATPVDTTISIAVEPDREIVQNAVMQFVDVYNEFRLFASTQQELGTDGLPTEDAVLANNGALRAAITSVGTEVTRVINGITGSNPSRLVDVGVNFDNFAGDDENPATKNIMTVDTDKLAAALAANFEGVRGLFEYQMTADNPNLVTFSRTNDLNVTSFVLTINRTTNTYQATFDNGNGPNTVDLDYAVSPDGGIGLKGKAGTALAGLQLIYAVDGDATINVNITQGFGDRLFNALEGFANPTTGTLGNAIKEIDSQTERNVKEIAKIDDFLVGYRERLINQYAQLESALTRSNQLLALLGAQADARNNA